jgi:hypothetical protein
MRRFIFCVTASALLCLWSGGAAEGRGFGGFRGFGGGFGGFRGFGGFGGGFGGERSFGGYHYGGGERSFDYSGSRSVSDYSGSRGGYGRTSSYDRTYTGSRGGSVTAEGTRGAAYGPGGAAVGGSREVTATGAEGRTYSGSR